MRYLILFILILASASAEAAQKVTISGYAPMYIGKEIKVYRIKDYLSDKQSMIASAQVKPDSTFQLSFFTEQIEKVVIRCENNRSFLYTEPGKNYSVLFPERNKYDPIIPSGNQVELTFFNLDSNDINYKILRYQRWMDYFIGGTYHLRNDKKSAEFSAKLDTFKTNVQAFYSKDSSDNGFFLKTYIRYSIAGLDNINTLAERNRYEKYDFYLDQYPVSYTNDLYMNYMTSFYEKVVPRMANETNELFYKGILRSSPTFIFNSLGKEYTLKNPRIRELVMIQSLAEAYYSEEYPKTNIETILDSLSKNSLFQVHEEIAANVLDRLTDLVPGGRAPNFVIQREGAAPKTLADYKDKYLYIHFMDPNSVSDIRELDIMKEMYENYNEYVQFLTFYPEKSKTSDALRETISTVPWEVYEISPDHAILERYRVVNYSHFVLIDPTGNVVASPAATPTPNGEYETIDRTFFYIKKRLDQSR